mmetsp:Transcript_27635/g.43505  ORF Transcript_27635/g.43505 Transcript_27635/m.43505 type:complete len:218 (+) Transcript_27635:36-689(+)
MDAVLQRHSRVIAGFVFLGIAGIVFWKGKKGTLVDDDQPERLQRSWSGIAEEYIPPLPKEVVDLLSIARLCYLSTSDGRTPHLSLMNFTYNQEDEVIIMSTRRDTKKFELLHGTNNNVAVLVHDFPHVRDQAVEESVGRAGGQNWSITLNGICNIASGAKEAEYRDLHLKNNPECPQFIVGENIAIIAVSITSARICNISDHVTYWSKDMQQQPLST